jgi:DNA adenine methylase
MITKPFLKWAGGKTRVAPHILPHLEGRSRLVEPFSGSCALFLQSDKETALLSDINPDLIRLYKTLQTHKEVFVDFIHSTYFDNTHNDLETYLAHRAQFNTLKDIDPNDVSSDESWTRSALFIYLNRHAFNGICRYNKSGGFNVPFGKYKTVYFPKAELTAFWQRSSTVTFKCASFVDIMKAEIAAADTNTVIYCDPPYIELSQTSSFTAYATQGFSADLQEELAILASQASKAGVKTLISNHDVPQARNLYEKGLTLLGEGPLKNSAPCQTIKSFDVRRSISAKGASRKNAPELLAIYDTP